VKLAPLREFQSEANFFKRRSDGGFDFGWKKKYLNHTFKYSDRKIFSPQTLKTLDER
jgi:hypothetical protein